VKKENEELNEQIKESLIVIKRLRDEERRMNLHSDNKHKEY